MCVALNRNHRTVIYNYNGKLWNNIGNIIFCDNMSDDIMENGAYLNCDITHDPFERADCMGTAILNQIIIVLVM